MAKPKSSAPVKKKKAPPRPNSKPATAPLDDVPEVTGSQEAYERFLPDAQGIAERDVRGYRLDPSLAVYNVGRGVDALLPLVDRIRKELPTVDVEHLRSLPDLALGVSFAAAQVDRGSGTSKPLAEPLRRAYELRETMLTSAVALAAAKVVPAREVEKIQEGRGPMDAAQDCVDLAALFTKHATALRGKTPVTAAQVTEAGKLGTSLLTMLRPKSAKRDRAPTGTLKDTVDARDRLATLLWTRHDVARRAGHWLWGDAVDRYVPALQARVAAKRKPSKPPEK